MSRLLSFGTYYAMLPLAHVAIHASQFPETVRLDLLESLRARKVNHKFHYDSLKQTQKWLALHQACSPSRTDPTCSAIYQQSFSSVVQKMPPGPVQVIGLGCGGGQKDTALLKVLHEAGRQVSYTPCDVSTTMVLVARESALSVVGEADCYPLVCDLATATNLSSVLPVPVVRAGTLQPVRLFTFFGMLPNFEPGTILPKLSNLVGSGDVLLVSANLAPGSDYAAGVEQVLPLYDNELTRDWLLTFLLDLGVDRTDGQVRFGVEDFSGPVCLKRIVAHFDFARGRTLQLDSEQFRFHPGDTIRLFFSYRHTPELIRELLHPQNLEVRDEWIMPSQQEGVFLVRKNAIR